MVMVFEKNAARLDLAFGMARSLGGTAALRQRYAYNRCIELLDATFLGKLVHAVWLLYRTVLYIHSFNLS